MKKRWLKMAAVLCAAAVFAAMAGGCGAGAEGTAEPVETVISEMGIGETYFDPPEQVTIQIEERDKTYTWEYQYTADIPLDVSDINIGGFSDLRNISYYYENEDGCELQVDEQGRIIGYSAPFETSTSQWKATSLTENAVYIIVEGALNTIANVSLQDFPDTLFRSNGVTSAFYAYEDRGSPCTDYIIAQIKPDGSLHSFTIRYNDLDVVSADDKAYFADMIEDYLLSTGKSQYHTIETYYEAHENTLIARFTVTYNDPEQGAWVENYVAGLPVER